MPAFFWMLSKTCQIAGIVLLGYSLYHGIVEDDMYKELHLLLVGAAVFGLGRLMERRLVKE